MRRNAYHRPEATRQDEAEVRVLGRRKALVRLLLAQARDLARIEASRHYEYLQCASMRDYGERVLSLSARETYETAAVGRAIRMFPGLEDRVLDGRTTPEAAAVLALLARHPDALRPEDPCFCQFEGLERAEKETARTLRKMVNRRLAEVMKRASRPLTVHLDDQGFEDLERARQILSPSEGEPTGPSEAVKKALRHLVHTKDILERKPGKRRMPRTDVPRPGLSPDSRRVPAEVRRGLLQRAGNKCRIPYCDNDLFIDDLFVDTAHGVRHVDGGSRELSNLEIHCRRHHVMQERRLIRNLGTTAAPRFVDAEGQSIHVRRLARGRPLPPLGDAKNGAGNHDPPA